MAIDLVQLLVLVIVAGVVWYLVGVIPMRQEFKTAALAIVALIFILWLLQAVGIFHPWRL